MTTLVQSGAPAPSPSAPALSSLVPMMPEQLTAAIFDLGHMVSDIGQAVAEMWAFFVGPHVP
jgi:hypothetical protein